MSGKLILIGGISRSGKSTLAKNLAFGLKNSVHLEQDLFALPEEQLPVIQNRFDWDAPESINWLLWKKSITESLERYEWVIAEGIFAFQDIEINSLAHFTMELLMQKKAYLKERKIETRWGHEPQWFLEHVWSSHLKNHNPHHLTFDLSCSKEALKPLNKILSQMTNKD